MKKAQKKRNAVKIPFVFGDRVWTFRQKCVKPGEEVKCPRCSDRHTHGPRFKFVPVKAKVESITNRGASWTCELGWKADGYSSRLNFRRSCHVWSTKEEAQVYCDEQNALKKRNAT